MPEPKGIQTKTGIYFCNGKFRASIYNKKQCYYLGLFDTEDEAIYIRQQAEKHKGLGFIVWYRNFRAKQKAEQSPDLKKYDGMITEECKERLRTLPDDKQMKIAEKYYDGYRVWG